MLNGRDIEKLRRLKATGVQIEPFRRENLKAGSYSFTLGDTLRKLKEPRHTAFLDSREHQYDFVYEKIDANNGYLLRPHEFVICHTAETLTLGPHVGCFLSMRGRLAQMGLDFLNNEIFCEPGSRGGWDGKLMLETTNRGPYPVKLFPGITVVKGIFKVFQHPQL
jgi:dCTP deaminase